MGKIQIAASGSTVSERANSRGKLFEKIISVVLRCHGYEIDEKPNVNYAGMEIDIVGHSALTGIPLYAECKCYETDIESKHIQNFFGKYMSRWLRDKRCQGLMVVIPRLNSHAKGFYDENCSSQKEIAFGLLQEKEVFEALVKSNIVVSEDVCKERIPIQAGTAGETQLLYTDIGVFWGQLVIPPGSGTPTQLVLMDNGGKVVTDNGVVAQLLTLFRHFSEFKLLQDPIVAKSSGELPLPGEEVVEVRGSSAPFEYQFPAAPQFFVGRQAALDDVLNLANDVIAKRTSSRGVLLEANSGLGKSSTVLSAVDLLRKRGHFAIAIDSRSASSSTFILRAINYAVRKYLEDADLTLGDVSPDVTGFDGAAETLITLGRALEKNSKCGFIFFDQFENIFFLPETLRRIRDIHLRIGDAQTNVILGFAWKTDLIGSTNDFPYKLRASIADTSKKIPLDTFSEDEIKSVLDKLESELSTKLRKDLRFFISEFSQGYPWLITKLCSHVKSQLEVGKTQSSMASSLLNVEELFRDDLRGLSAEEDHTLKQIARKVPIAVPDLGEEFDPEVVQSLVHRRLLVRIGNKYDVYWDIFRDYLNSGKVPVQQNFILRMQPGRIIGLASDLSKRPAGFSLEEFRKHSGHSETSFINVLRELKVLALVQINAERIVSAIKYTDDDRLTSDLRNHIRERLLKNRLVQIAVSEVESAATLPKNEVSAILARACPYIAATKKTWGLYAHTLSDWADYADILFYNVKTGALSKRSAQAEIRERPALSRRRGSGLVVPAIQVDPIILALERIVAALRRRTSIDWSKFKPSTKRKAVVSLEDLGFIKRKEKSIQVFASSMEFVDNPDRRAALFAERALRMPAFKSFIDILNACDERLSHADLATRLTDVLKTGWKAGTGTTTVKIMLDWARYSDLAPLNFKGTRRN